MKKILGLALSLCLLSACSHEVALTYNCVPSGAVVYEEGIGRVGTCPVIVKYNPFDVKIADNKLTTNKIKVIWVSGASLVVPPTLIDIPDDHAATITFTRPADFTDAVKDEEFSASYDASLPTPQVRYYVTPNQTKSIFDDFNHSFTCGVDTLTEAVTAQCD